MQATNTILFIAIEIYVALLICAIIFYIHIRKLKSLLRRQQEKIITLLRESQNNHKASQQITPNLSTKPTQNYKSYLKEALEATSERYSQISSNDIGSEQTDDSPLLQKILALRYAFLRAEELGTTEPAGSTEYWNIFQQALHPLLAPIKINNEELKKELKNYKKRIENLEKFELLFFNVQKKWADAQANAENYYEQLASMSNEFTDQQGFNEILKQYHSVYDGIHKTINETTDTQDSIRTKTVIKITRQDPRATEEIRKLRNVSAEQHRTINQLQRKLHEATTTVEKEAVFQELHHQLERQTRFVQESETCIQLLEDELSKAHEELSLQGAMLAEQSEINEENQQMKSALHNFSLKSEELVNNIASLEKENAELKQNNQPNANNTLSTPRSS